MDGNRYWEDLARQGAAIARERLADTRALLAFLTVLPVGRGVSGLPGFAGSLRAMPLAGAVIGALGAAALLVCALLGLPPLLSAALTVAVLVGSTGALHEDALSDVADGFGGGATRERKLEIMRDSRLGTYGAAALVLALLIRVTALGGLLAGPGGLTAALAAVFAAAVLSRSGCVAVLALLDPARGDGLGAHAGRPGREVLNEALAVGAVLAGTAVLAGAGVGALVPALAAGALAAWGMIALARAQIGGQTGDVAGACQQAVECAVVVAIAAATGL